MVINLVLRSVSFRVELMELEPLTLFEIIVVIFLFVHYQSSHDESSRVEETLRLDSTRLINLVFEGELFGIEITDGTYRTVIKSRLIMNKYKDHDDDFKKSKRH